MQGLIDLISSWLYEGLFYSIILIALQKKLLGQDPESIAARRGYAFIGYKGKVLGKWVQQRQTNSTKGGILLDATIPLNPGEKRTSYVLKDLTYEDKIYDTAITRIKYLFV